MEEREANVAVVSNWSQSLESDRQAVVLLLKFLVSKFFQCFKKLSNFFLILAGGSQKNQEAIFSTTTG